MAGLDHDVAARAVRCDPTPLNRLGEAWAQMSDRCTYALTWRADHYELDHRYAGHIDMKPAASVATEEILTEHICGINVPANCIAAFTITRPSRKVLDDAPPF